MNGKGTRNEDAGNAGNGESMTCEFASGISDEMGVNPLKNIFSNHG